MASDRTRELAKDWGECIICGMCSTMGHDWWCPRNPNPPECAKGEHQRPATQPTPEVKK